MARQPDRKRDSEQMAAGSSDDQPAASGASGANDATDATDKSVTGRAAVQSERKHACCFKVGLV